MAKRPRKQRVAKPRKGSKHLLSKYQTVNLQHAPGTRRVACGYWCFSSEWVETVEETECRSCQATREFQRKK